MSALLACCCAGDGRRHQRAAAACHGARRSCRRVNHVLPRDRNIGCWRAHSQNAGRKRAALVDGRRPMRVRGLRDGILSKLLCAPPRRGPRALSPFTRGRCPWPIQHLAARHPLIPSIAPRHDALGPKQRAGVQRAYHGRIGARASVNSRGDARVSDAYCRVNKATRMHTNARLHACRA